MVYLLMFAIIICLLIFLHKREDQTIQERKDLLDRVMAKTYVEYKESTQEPVKFEPVSLTEEQEYWNELESKRL